MKRRLLGFTSVFVFRAMLILSVGSVQAQTPGRIPMFGQPNTGACNAAAGNDCIDSIITQAGGNIGVGTNTPAAKLDIVGGNLNLEDSTATSGNILKAGVLFLSNFGINNTFMGRNAGNLMVSGDANTGIGVNALANNTTGRFNTATGVDALGGGNMGSFNTATGVSALRDNIEGSSNTATGWAALITNDDGYSNTANGVGALENNISGFENTATGVWALHDADQGTHNTAIGAFADVTYHDLSNATAIGYNAKVNASNKIRLGNTQVTVVEGPPYSTVSDKNAKENFKPVDVDEVLRKIRHLNVTSWNYIGQDPKQFRHYGPVAQDFFAAFGDDGVGTIGSPTTITSTDMNGVLVLAVQALGRENDAFKAENAELKTRIEALEELVKRTPQ